MSRLDGPKRTPSWVWLIIALILIIFIVLGLDYFDIIPLHLY